MSHTPSIGIDGKPLTPVGDHDPRFNYRSGTLKVDPANRQKPSEHGRVLGAAFAKIADEQAVLHPEIPERCASCAFRAGTIPNQMSGTLVEAMHCVIGTDPNPFACHEKVDDTGTPTHYCAGYLLARKADFDDVKSVLMTAFEQLGAL